MLKPAIALLLLILMLAALSFFAADAQQARRLDFDRQNLKQFFAEGSYDNDLVIDSYLIPAQREHPRLVNQHLLGLERDRLAYRARKDGEVVAIAVPASADDGFNGRVDLLVSVDMFGRIGAARVVSDVDTDALYGVVDVIESRWMEEFSGKAMRNILGVTWTSISDEREYDQFVGASITPKAVADRIYEALVFVQSNRIELMNGEN